MTVQDAHHAVVVSGGEISDVKPGMINDVKNLYQSKPGDAGRTTWVDEYPDDLVAAAENAESAKYALLIRNKKCYSGRRSLEIDSIIVQSPLLKVSLRKVLKGYPGITTDLERLVFAAPFEPFVHRWKALVRLLEDESDLEAKAHLSLLYRTLEVELRDDLRALDDCISNGVITYSTCWMLFEPGALVFGIRAGQPAVARLKESHYVSNQCGEFLSLSCALIDWDGENFGYGTASFEVGAFAGTAVITKLSALPLSYHPHLNRMKAELVERGRFFQALSGYHYKYYQGIAIGHGLRGPIKYNVDSRIIIDTYAWNRFNPNRKVSLEVLGRNNKGATSENKYCSDGDEQSDDDVSYGNDSYGKYTDVTCDAEFKPTSLTTTQLLMCSASLKGYSLKNKKWLIFSIDSVRDIKFNRGAFDSLVLPSDHKELILALTESQVKNKETFDDVIQGKGKGMVLLLSGPPGVGKTLTAESVAEQLRAPLYVMSAGDLGITSAEVQSSLTNVLEMATKWDAILLLDEADVFLEQRSPHDLKRNKLVSIFLRILEYYEGTLFLTSNRVENIDGAFQSRIHISMQYKELGSTSRKQVWNNFLTASSKGKGYGLFSDKDLNKLADYKMNGREIKNTLKTAQLLASKKDEVLNVGHVESVLAIEQRRLGAKAPTIGGK